MIENIIVAVFFYVLFDQGLKDKDYPAWWHTTVHPGTYRTIRATPEPGKYIEEWHRVVETQHYWFPRLHLLFAAFFGYGIDFGKQEEEKEGTSGENKENEEENRVESD